MLMAFALVCFFFYFLLHGKQVFCRLYVSITFSHAGAAKQINDALQDLILFSWCVALTLNT